MSNSRQYESLRRDFSDEEMARMHGELVQRCGEVKTLRAEKAQATTTFLQFSSYLSVSAPKPGV